MKYAYEIAKGKVNEIAKLEYKKANNAKLGELISKLKVKKEGSNTEEVKVPEKEVVTSQISGVDILDLEGATKLLWKQGIYAESGMGCTGPIVLVNSSKKPNAKEILKDAGYIS